MLRNALESLALDPNDYLLGKSRHVSRTVTSDDTLPAAAFVSGGSLALDSPANALQYAAYHSGDHKILIGTSSGDILICGTALEIQSTMHLGQPISCMASAKLVPQSELEIVIGDSDGISVVMGGTHVLKQSHVGGPVTAIAAYTGNDGNAEIVASNSQGMITCLDVYGHTQWRMSLASASEAHDGGMIRCIMVAKLLDMYSRASVYTLVLNRSKCLSFLSGNNLVLNLDLPSSCHTMCQGRFWKSKDANGAKNFDNPHFSQVALGGADGTIFLVDNFEVFEYSKIDFEITVIDSIRLSDVDLVVCGGHFCSLLVFCQGRV